MKKYKLIRNVLVFLYKAVIISVVKKVNIKISQNIPKYEISDIHIKNARLITTREELLRIFPQNGVAAELGVDEGDFSNLILSINKPKKLHLIDFWGSKRYNQDKRKKLKKDLRKILKTKQSKLI